MYLGANMRGDQADDPLGFGGVNTQAGIASPLTESVDPEPAVGVDHHLDDGGVAKGLVDRRPHGRLEHGPAAFFGGRAHGLTSPSLVSSERLPPAIWRPTCSTNFW